MDCALQEALEESREKQVGTAKTRTLRLQVSNQLGCQDEAPPRCIPLILNLSIDVPTGCGSGDEVGVAGVQGLESGIWEATKRW